MTGSLINCLDAEDIQANNIQAVDLMTAEALYVLPETLLDYATIQGPDMLDLYDLPYGIKVLSGDLPTMTTELKLRSAILQQVCGATKASLKPDNLDAIAVYNSVIRLYSHAVSIGAIVVAMSSSFIDHFSIALAAAGFSSMEHLTIRKQYGHGPANSLSEVLSPRLGLTEEDPEASFEKFASTRVLRSDTSSHTRAKSHWSSTSREPIEYLVGPSLRRSQSWKKVARSLAKCGSIGRLCNPPKRTSYQAYMDNTSTSPPTSSIYSGESMSWQSAMNYPDAENLREPDESAWPLLEDKKVIRPMSTISALLNHFEQISEMK